MVTNREETQDARRVADLSDRYDIPVKSIHAPFLMAARKVWGGFHTKIERSLEMAEKLGAEVVVLHLPYFWQLNYARWVHRDFNSRSHADEVELAMENAMLVNFGKLFNLSLFNSLEELAHFDNLVFDTSHFAIAGVDIIEAWNGLRGKVRHIHLSNNYLKGFDDHALPFEGRLPLDRFLGVLNRDGYDGLVVLELGPGPLEARLGEERILQNLKLSLEYCLHHYQAGMAPAR